MREELANLVHPVFAHALHLKDRLRQGDTLVLETEQAALKGLLLSDLESRRWTDFGGELDTMAIESTRGAEPRRSGS